MRENKILMQEPITETILDTTPLLTQDTVVFGLLMVALGFIFYLSDKYIF